MIALLEALGRRGAPILAAGVFIGLALPDLAAFMRPALTPAVFLLMVLAMTRVRTDQVRHHLARPRLLIAALLWVAVVLPALIGLARLGIGPDRIGIDLTLGLVLLTSAPPIFSAPAIMYLLGLDGALSLALMLIATSLTPLIAPAAVEFFVGPGIPLSPYVLFRNLAFLVGGAYLCAIVVRKLMGPARLEASQGIFDGLNVLLMLVFAVALMDGIGARFIAEPLRFLSFVGLVTGIVAVMMAVTMALFWRTGARTATTIGYSAAFCNMALAVGAVGGAVPDDTWTLFAVNQFPIYFSPMILGPICRRLLDRTPD